MTNLPHLSTDYPISREQNEQYQRDGHIFLKSIASQEEVEAYRPLITGIVDEVAKSRDPQGRISDYGKMFTQVTNVWRKNEDVRRFVFSRRLARIAAELMGVNGVRLYHDQALIKEPRGKQTPWHQDYYYWPLDTQHTVTMWIPLLYVPH